MACCHTASWMDDIMVGDPLDIQMFEASKWVLDEEWKENSKEEGRVFPPNYQGKYALSLLKRFDFNSNTMRMSSIVRDTKSGKVFCFCKGSPEKIQSLCDISSLPADFESVLDWFTSEGLRVIALSYKEIHGMSDEQVVKLEWNQAESELRFLGLLIFINKLKGETV